jgi:hypothetical protein
VQRDRGGPWNVRRGLTLAALCVVAATACDDKAPAGLPQFQEPAAGPSAPSNKLLGVRVGQTLRRDIDALIDTQKLDCRDLSPTTLGAKMRARRRPKTSPDATARASPNKAGNPQVRLSCPSVSGPQIGDRDRDRSRGRWLFVFDSPEHPLRHTSFRRRHTDHTAANRDLSAAVAALTAAYGPPTSRSQLPAEFKKFHPYKWEWRFANVRVEASALNYGKRGVDVLETIEVPWPVRADAGAADYAR